PGRRDRGLLRRGAPTADRCRLRLSRRAASRPERSDVLSVPKGRDRDPIRVLFVCTANICRSPYLELRARQLFGPDAGVEVSSAGTDGFDAAPVSDTMA